MQWSVIALAMAWEEIQALPPGLQARMIRLMELVEEMGLESIHAPHAKHISGKLWELRAKAPEGIARGMYVTLSGRRVIVLHVFVKKTDKTPRRALALAMERMKEVLP